jgi:hypothetical protein
MRTFIFIVVLCLLIPSIAIGQTRSVAPASTDMEAAAEGSGDAVEERAHNPRANTAVQPERSEGNEDDLDQNEGDDGNNGTGGN